MQGKVDALRAWIGSCDWDVISNTETWLSNGQHWQPLVPRYTFYKRDRVGGKRIGEMTLLIKDNVAAGVQINKKSPCRNWL